MHCAGCQAPIIDRYLLNVLDRAWHIRCVQCVDCGAALTDKCFSRDGKLYCRSDFFRRFGTKCAGCSQGISPNDLVRKAQNKVFHLKCFTCMICRKQLSTGEELYIVGENKFLCKEDYIQNKLDGSDVDDDGMDFDSTLDSQDTVSDKDLFCDDKSHSLLKTEPKSCTDNVKSEVLMHPKHSLGMSNTLNDNYDSKLRGECPSPIKMEPVHPTDQIQMKLENGLCDALPTSPPSPDINMNCSTTSGPGSDESVDINDNVSCGDINDNDDQNDQNGNHSGPGSKRRGPRTTIKAKQLEILKAAFNATPKPTRHIREQLATETGLNMRVIQVWFQNRRSKERRMKQLSALGARRHFYRTPRRMRALRGELDEAEMMGPGYGYFNDSEPDMYGNFPPYNNFYPGQTPDLSGTMNYMMPPTHRGTPPQMEPGMMTSRGMVPDGHYMHGDILPPSSSPDCVPAPTDESYLSNGPGRPLGASFTSSLQNIQNRPEMTSEVW